MTLVTNNAVSGPSGDIFRWWLNDTMRVAPLIFNLSYVLLLDRAACDDFFITGGNSDCRLVWVSHQPRDTCRVMLRGKGRYLSPRNAHQNCCSCTERYGLESMSSVLPLYLNNSDPLPQVKTGCSPSKCHLHHVPFVRSRPGCRVLVSASPTRGRWPTPRQIVLVPMVSPECLIFPSLVWLVAWFLVPRFRE